MAHGSSTSFVGDNGDQVDLFDGPSFDDFSFFDDGQLGGHTRHKKNLKKPAREGHPSGRGCFAPPGTLPCRRKCAGGVLCQYKRQHDFIQKDSQLQLPKCGFLGCRPNCRGGSRRCIGKQRKGCGIPGCRITCQGGRRCKAKNGISRGNFKDGASKIEDGGGGANGDADGHADDVAHGDADMAITGLGLGDGGNNGGGLHVKQVPASTLSEAVDMAISLRSSNDFQGWLSGCKLIGKIGC